MPDFGTQVVELKLNFRKPRQLSIQLNKDVLDLLLHNRWQTHGLTSCRTWLALRLDAGR